MRITRCNAQPTSWCEKRLRHRPPSESLCQVTVNCHYAERTLAWPVATRLYLPKDWAADEARRDKAQVPEEIAFRTKPQIALDLLDQAKAWRNAASAMWSPSAPTSPWR